MRILGAVGIVFGAWWLWAAVAKPAAEFFNSGEGSAETELPPIMVLLPLLLMVGLGLAIIYCGIGLLRQKRGESWQDSAAFNDDDKRRLLLATDPLIVKLRYLLGLVASVGVLGLGASAESLWYRWRGDAIDLSLPFLLIATVCGVAVYIPAARWFLGTIGIRKVELRFLISQFVVFLVALTLWMLGAELVRVFDRHRVTDRFGLRHWAGLAAMFLPILGAWIFYKTSVRCLRFDEPLLSARRKSEAEPDTESFKK